LDYKGLQAVSSWSGGYNQTMRWNGIRYQKKPTTPRTIIRGWYRNQIYL